MIWQNIRFTEREEAALEAVWGEIAEEEAAKQQVSEQYDESRSVPSMRPMRRKRVAKTRSIRDDQYSDR